MSLACLMKFAKVNGLNAKISVLMKDLMAYFRQESTVSTSTNASPKHMVVTSMPNVSIIMVPIHANVKQVMKT